MTAEPLPRRLDAALAEAETPEALKAALQPFLPEIESQDEQTKGVLREKVYRAPLARVTRKDAA